MHGFYLCSFFYPYSSLAYIISHSAQEVGIRDAYDRHGTWVPSQWYIQCRNPAHINCNKSRQTTLDTPEFGDIGFRYYMKTWQAAVFRMDNATHNA